MLNKMFVLGLTVALLSSHAFAGRAGQRQVNQHNRIAQGVKSGELTRPEARRLARGQANVRQEKREALSDGSVDAAERAKIERMQDRQSERIYNQKHDEQNRD